MSELTALSAEIGKMSGNMINNPHFIFDSLSSPLLHIALGFPYTCSRSSQACKVVGNAVAVEA
uniref:Uncharacterized protein n=1 Tax=Caldilinea aerophila TaxID=133453 RepID=A0A7C1FMC6_9CHLR